MTTDLLTIGEALLRLTPPNHQLIEQSSLLEVHIGGSELNTAVGLARLGLQVSWSSRLTDNVIGRRIAQTLTAQGVDTSHVIWTDEDRIGTYYMEEGIGSRPSQVTYDRAHSAMSHIQPADLNPHAILAPKPRWLHLTGITLAISQSSAATVKKLHHAYAEQNIPMSFDVNFRSKLWDVQTAVSMCADYMKAAAVLFIPARDAVTLFDHDDLRQLHTQYPQATIVMTRGAHGADAITPDGEMFHQDVFPTETVCRIGGGDAFAAGYLYAHLTDHPTPMCLRHGAAVASLKYSMAGDMPLVNRYQVEQLVFSEMGRDVQR